MNPLLASFKAVIDTVGVVGSIPIAPTKNHEVPRGCETGSQPFFFWRTSL
jgi:hypothetical protein